MSVPGGDEWPVTSTLSTCLHLQWSFIIPGRVLIMQAPPDSDSDSSEVIIHQGPASTVSRIWAVVDDTDVPVWVASKTSRTNSKCEPHDIVKELRMLSSISHENIISVLGEHYDPDTRTLQFYMPFIQHSLDDLLQRASFSPYANAQENAAADFNIVAKSIMFQTLSALVFLHDPIRLIAHRDIKPSNILFTPEGRVKLIDFGICYQDAKVDISDHKKNIWPETPERMYFEVSTGPYRAPELLFGTRSYNACATDLWSLGCTFAEFFTCLRYRMTGECDDVPNTDSQDCLQPFMRETNDPDGEWSRDSLFNGTRGELGLAWSIFKIRGTPNEETWPGFELLPDALRISFTVVPPIDLQTLLPNLPPDSNGLPFALVNGLLSYPPDQRLEARTALQNTWFSTEPSALIGEDDYSQSLSQWLTVFFS